MSHVSTGCETADGDSR